MGFVWTAPSRWRPLSRRKFLFTCAALCLVLASAAAWVLQDSITARRRARSIRAALASGQLNEARARLKQWRDESPRSAEVHFLGAQAALATGDLAEVSSELSKAKELGYADAEIGRLYAIVLSRLGRHAEAEPILLDVLAARSGPDPEVDEALARVYLETYRLDEAARVIDHWIHDSPRDAKPYLWLTEIDRRAHADDLPLRIRHYRRALELDPHLDKALLGLAETLRDAHQAEESATVFDRYLERNPKDVAALVGAGRNARERGDDAAAIRYLDRALTLAPADVIALKERAGIDQRRGELGQALERLNKAIAADPFDNELLYSRALVFEGLGRLAEAKQDRARRAQLEADQAALIKIRDRLQKDPNNNDLRCQVAAWMLAHGRPQEGLRWLKQIVNEQPGHAAANRLLADYHERQGESGLANYYRLRGSDRSP